MNLTISLWKILKRVSIIPNRKETIESYTHSIPYSELPENSPRFIVLSYELHHKDGRTSFPLVLIYWAPQTSSMELKTLYTRYVDQPS